MWQWKVESDKLNNVGLNPNLTNKISDLLVQCVNRNRWKLNQNWSFQRGIDLLFKWEVDAQMFNNKNNGGQTQVLKLENEQVVLRK